MMAILKLLHFPFSKPQIAARLYSYIHLSLIPTVYLVVDFLNRNKLKKAKAVLTLDGFLFFTGLACIFAGLAAKNPLFEHGAVASILILANFMYSQITLGIKE